MRPQLLWPVTTPLVLLAVVAFGSLHGEARPSPFEQFRLKVLVRDRTIDQRVLRALRADLARMFDTLFRAHGKDRAFVEDTIAKVLRTVSRRIKPGVEVLGASMEAGVWKGKGIVLINTAVQPDIIVNAIHFDYRIRKLPPHEGGLAKTVRYFRMGTVSATKGLLPKGRNLRRK